MSNTSATGGYLVPSSSQGLPGSLTLEQFIQTVIVGVSAYPGTLVRPKWQVAPPKQPDIGTDWIAFAYALFNTDQNAWVGMDADENTLLKRQEDIEVQISFYGPNAQENISLFHDGFQIQQNLEALMLADMGYRGITPAMRGPDLVNERWIERFEMSLMLTRQVLRTYPILSFVSAGGIIHTVVDGQAYDSNWLVGGP